MQRQTEGEEEGREKSDLLIFLGGDFLKKVRDGLSLRHMEAHALEEGHYPLPRPMEY